MEAYLDNSATTRPFEDVDRIMMRTMTEDYGNPSSRHIKGMQAEQYVKHAKEQIAKTLKVQEKEIIFTSGGTESNNLALIGAALANRRSGNKLISTSFEHASVYNTLGFLEECGFTVDYTPVDTLGHVILPELLNRIDDQTILVSVMMVNNEVGSVQDLAAISRAVKAKKPDILFHVDAIQAYGKFRINPKKLGIDLLSVSGHKIHGPKGSGFLYADEHVKLKPILYGGGQQKGMRSGTENVPAIAGLGLAAEMIYTDHEQKISHLYELKKRLIDGAAAIPGTVVNAVPHAEGALPTMEEIRTTAPQIVSISFEGVKSEVLLHALEEKGIYVSSGSACSSNHPALSGTLKAIGVKEELLDSTLRFSFSVMTTEEEIDYTLQMLAELLPQLRRFTRR